MTLDKKTLIKISIILLTVILGFVATPWQIKNFIDVEKNIKKIREDITTIQEDANTRPVLTDSQAKVKDEISALKDKVVSYQDISSLQAYVSAQAKEASIEIVETGSAPAQPYKKIGKDTLIGVPISLSIHCKYHNLGVFIAQIEQGKYPLKVNSVVISGEKTGGLNVNLGIIALAKE